MFGANACKKFRTNKGRSHTYDVLSGWCIYGCGNRDDGRIVTREGNVIEKGPQYTNAELGDMLARQREIVEARTPARAAR